HHFLHDAPWEAEALNQRRLEQWRGPPWAGAPPPGGALFGGKGGPQRGGRPRLAGPQKPRQAGDGAQRGGGGDRRGARGPRHVPVGVKPYRPASRLPRGRQDPAFHTKPDLAWQLIAEARAAQIPFHLVVADSVYGESAQLEGRLFAAKIAYVMGLRPSHGTWQEVEDPAQPPAFTPAE